MTPVVGVYSARNVPGKWFTDRAGDRFLYHKPPCFGCELERPEECAHGLVCMTSHTVGEVADAVRAGLADE